MYRLVLTLGILLAPIMWGTPACAPQTPIQNTQNNQDFRIATLSPSLSLILQDLDLEDHIVGRHGFDTFLNPDTPVVGDQAGIDYEQLARAQPTHVLLEWGTRKLPPRLLSIAEQSGWLVKDFTLLSIDDLPLAIATLGNLFDAQDKAQELQHSLRSALAPLDNPPIATFLPMYWASPIGVAGPGSFHAQLLSKLGLSLAIDSGPAYLEMESEDLARLNPSVLVLFAPNADDERIQTMLASLSPLKLDAIEHSRIIVITDPTCLSLSARIIPIAYQIKNQLSAINFD